MRYGHSLDRLCTGGCSLGYQAAAPGPASRPATEAARDSLTGRRQASGMGFAHRSGLKGPVTWQWCDKLRSVEKI